MVTFLIVWYIIGVILIWISEWKRGNVRRLSQKPFIDTLYAIGVSLLSWIAIAWVIVNIEDYSGGTENMKYNIGDKVRIKSLDWYNKHKNETDDIECSNNIWFYREMSKFCGKVMTISHVRVDYYTMVEDLVGYWTDEMIECKVEE